MRRQVGQSTDDSNLSEVTKMTETLTTSVKDSFKPVNERVTATVEKFQATRLADLMFRTSP